MYCINSKTLLIMLASTLFVASPAHSELMDEEINSLMNSVPAKQLDREREIQRLDHVKAVMERLADIRDSKARIDVPEEKTNGSDSVTYVENIEQSIKAALSSQGNASEQSATLVPDTKKTFTEDVELISLWGDQASPTADIFMNGRVTQVKKGSFIQGWEIINIGSGYMTLKKEKSTAKVFFANIADEG